jgi:RNA polymerase sigma-70 factor (ECF subfamily)
VFDLESGFRRSPIPVDSTSPELLAASKTADPAAWEKLVVVYSPLVYSWVRLSGIPPEDAKDIVQNVLRAVFNNLDNFDAEREEGSFRGWLRTITNNKVIDQLRSKANVVQATGGSDAQRKMNKLQAVAESLSSADLADVRDGDDVGRVLERVRGDFTDRTWRAFWGMTVEQRSSSDLAQELNISPAAVRLAKSEVIHRLCR